MNIRPTCPAGQSLKRLNPAYEKSSTKTHPDFPTLKMQLNKLNNNFVVGPNPRPSVAMFDKILQGTLDTPKIDLVW